jgi:hypothetical protein
MTEGGLKELCDLGLDDAPLGISIWIGKYLTIQVSDGDYGREYDVEPKGSFRAPTEEEWSAIRQGRSPWDFPQVKEKTIESYGDMHERGRDYGGPKTRSP